MRLPSSIFVSVSLFTAETTAALYLSSTYRSDGDQIWQGLTLLFTLVTSVLVQLTLTFIHRDLSRDRPLVLLLHILQLGPIVRCLEAFCIYGSVGRVEEPYVSITRKRQMPRGGQSEEVERQVGQAEGKLFTHRAAFARTSVIQAFLGSAPQLTLQLYICVLQQGVSIGRGTLMVISLLSIVYGALRCNILAIKIKYDDYEVDVRPAAYLCIFLWRSFEIATRVTVLVLFSSVLQLWILPVVLLNFFLFFLYPWVLFWQSHSPFPENIEKTLTRVGTTIVLCLLTFLYAGINMFCWSAVQLKLNDPDLINKSQNWYRMAVYYMLRFVENASLLLLWYIYKTDFYRFICAPLLVLQLLVAYAMAIFFMLVFYQFCHPCRKLFSSNMTQGLWDCSALLCLVCYAPDRDAVRPIEKAGLDPLAPDPTPHTETANDTSYDVANDTAYTMPNDTMTYDMPNDTTHEVLSEMNGDVSHSLSSNT
ncbi:membrane transport protein XK [Oncorhynchus nerka]|uniref:XK-related protein n=2 Tax=Oncorhynchus TaxID=8016 RepID=A0A8C7I5K8_ONCKI|nr:membrane transport protein XK [Oncorhynchus kisutch]XP_021453513.1 membrane transport protein XK [Oncorhynchus mykiss]XP_029495624.1 membrane transport protein XK-like [Oncorhynchus nerka]XP_035605350.1 membrane transport protein XK [Oncorhynchus keta]XP_046219601.1 membrane transport protein XK [Oncorhynchus gorbuscha]